MKIYVNANEVGNHPNFSMKLMKNGIVSCLLLMIVATACNPSVKRSVWENELCPEMSSQKGYLVIADQLGIGVIQTDRLDPTPAEHIGAAIDYVNSFIIDSLDSFSDVRFIYDTLLQKDEAGELNIEPSKAEKLAVAWFNAMGISIDNYTKKYVLNIAQYIQTQFENLSIELDTPEFEKKTKDRITYSVYCPTYNETYTLSYNRNTENYNWDLTPVEE